LIVEIRYRGKPIIFRIANVSSETAFNKTFKGRDGRTMNIVDYFQQQYGIRLKYEKNFPKFLKIRLF
jgi:hypothetical protein